MTATLTRLIERESIRDTAKLARRLHLAVPAEEVGPTLKPMTFDERSGNQLRPRTFAEMSGQPRLKALLKRLVDNSKATERPLDHMLLIGASGTGKTTIATVIANELGHDVYMLKCPVGQDVLEELATVAKDGDVVVLDECQLQVTGDRRGITAAADIEGFYHFMEDRRLMSEHGVIECPALTFIGCTTDGGVLPTAFIGRFPLQPHIDPYSETDMIQLADHNATALGLTITTHAARIFARACRGNPRIINQYLRNAASLSAGEVTGSDAIETVKDLNSCTLDGLTASMQGMLTFLLKSRREAKDGTVTYQASVNTIATALGFSRDAKNVALTVEPYLIERGLVQVAPQGRCLTDAGVARAEKLL
jgi:Holliday junction DNA helicase RuvB